MAHVTIIIVVLKLQDKTVPEKIQFGRKVVTEMTGNANFPDPPGPDPTLDDVSTRSSMHTDAHALELKYQIGGTESVNPEATNQSATFTKARHNLQLDVDNAGQFFYGFARWTNTSENSKSGPYSLSIKMIISN